jgi:hypothetical protein
VANGKDGKVFVSEDLCNKVLKNSTVFAHIAQELGEHHQRIQKWAVDDYISFVEQQSKKESSNYKFPEFNLQRFDGQFEPPGEKKLRSVFDKAFDLIYIFLRRILFNQKPGWIIQLDATFKFAIKTKNNPLSGEEFKGLAINFGTHEHMVNWGFIESEGPIVFSWLQYFLRQQLIHLHGK